MPRYDDHDQLAAEALQICEDVREFAPLGTYQHLATQCVRDPERMAQIIMCLAVWSDLDIPIGVLGDRAEAIGATRGRPPGARHAS